MKMIQKSYYPNFLPGYRTRSFKSATKVCTLITMLVFSACATVAPPPTQALQAAESAIDNADQQRVSDYALPEMRVARDKLTAARAAMQKEEMVLAQRLADESRVSAELASAKAEKIKAARINEDMKNSIDTLEEEMQRNNGEKP